MAVWLIPTFSTPLYRQTVRLDGTNYVLSFAFNQRAAVWHLSISSIADVPLASGLKIVSNRRLLGARTKVGLPPGDLVAVTTSTDLSPPGLGDLGEGLRCELLYFDAGALS